MHGDFFPRLLLSRNHKIHIVARVGRKSAVVLPGLMEASYSHVFLSGKVSIVRAPFSGVRREASKTITDKPPDTLGILESTSPRKDTFDEAIPPEDDF